MANLNISNINSIVQNGNIEELFGKNHLEEVHSSSEKKEASFSDILENSIEKVNDYQSQADTAIKEMIAGRNKNIHETMLTIERADTSLKLMMQVRNKILDAYKEIIRMQI
jgi:flagellar hook-basal body complex protein FliE